MDLDINVLPAVIVVAIMLLVGLPGPRVQPRPRGLPARRRDGQAVRPADAQPDRPFRSARRVLLALTFIGSAARGRVRVRLGQADAGQPAEPRGRPRGEAIVAAAGPASNLVLAAAAAHPAPLHAREPAADRQVPTSSLNVLDLFVQINLLLMIFNLIPIPPLDGSKVMFAFMDRRTDTRSGRCSSSTASSS